MAQALSRLLPDVKILFLMRNPLERSYSAAAMKEDKLAKGDATVSAGDNSHAHSLYSRILDNWCAFYPYERIFVGFMEDKASIQTSCGQMFVAF